jgi:hypothetical protein
MCLSYRDILFVDVFVGRIEAPPSVLLLFTTLHLYALELSNTSSIFLLSYVASYQNCFKHCFWCVKAP